MTPASSPTRRCTRFPRLEMRRCGTRRTRISSERTRPRMAPAVREGVCGLSFAMEDAALRVNGDCSDSKAHRKLENQRRGRGLGFTEKEMVSSWLRED